MISRGRAPRRESAKHKAEAQQRRAVVSAAFARDGRRCVAKDIAPGWCDGPLDPHEVIPRSAWRAGYLVLDNVVIVCRAHHDWIGENPDAAHAAGLHGYSWQVPS